MDYFRTPYVVDLFTFVNLDLSATILISICLFAEARREARKAFLAFASDEVKTQNSNAEPTDGDLENIPEQDVDAKSSKSTPVRSLPLLN